MQLIRAQFARSLTVYWPGLTLYWQGFNNDIENIVSSCSQCQDHLPCNAKEPIMFKSRPARPFQEVAADLCHHAGRYYLIIIDCYSDWPTIAPMGIDITSSSVISAFRTLFSQLDVSSRFAMVRWRTTVHGQTVLIFCRQVGICSP